MDSTRAGELAVGWMEEHDKRTDAVIDAYSWLVKEVEELLSDDALGGAALIDGTPAVVALDGERFCWLTLADQAGAGVVSHFGSLPLAQTSFEIDAVLEATGPGLMKTRTWSLVSGSGSVSITTRELRLGARVDAERFPSGEQVLREAARRGGQPLPSAEGS
jgi:hypothetical protein